MKRKIVYLQDDSYSCGSACIQSVISYYGGYVPLETVQDDTNTTATGTNAYEIVETLKKYGFNSHGEKIALADIHPIDLPVIAHVVRDGLEHFLVIYEIGEDYVLTMDPEFGEKRYRKDCFEKMYDEKAIFLFPDGEIPKYAPSHHIIKTLMDIVSSHKLLFATILVLCLLSTMLCVLTSFHFKLLSAVDDPLGLTLVFVMTQIVVSITLAVKSWLTDKLIERIDGELTSHITSHIFSLPLRFLSRKKTGEIVRKIEDATFIKDLSMRIVITNSLDVLLLIIAGLAMCTISKNMTFIYMLLAIISVPISIVLDRKTYRKNKANIRDYEEYTGTLIEYAAGIESIKNLNREEYAIAKLDTAFTKYAHNRRKLADYVNFSSEFKSFIFSAGQLILNFAAFLHLGNDFTFYDLVTMQSLFGLVTSSLQSLESTYYHLSKGKAITRSISEFLDIEHETHTNMKISRRFDNLKIEDLSYSYDRIHENLSHFDMTIHRGDKILVSGPSGIGKSTLVKCLCGRLQNYDGYISINGLDIASIEPSSLRRHILYIGQEETLFSGTIRENITAGRNSSELLDRVLDVANLRNMLATKPGNVDAIIQEGASNLSGGERARVILARALYERPSVLIIDETLSSISEEMEDEILKNILRDENLTVIYITHRQKEHLFERIIKFRKDGKYEIRNK